MHLRIAALILISAAGAAAKSFVVLQDFGIGYDALGGNWLYAGLTMDGSGNLYGAAYLGGTYNHGVVYELSPNGSGGWTETVLYDFKGTDVDQDGAGPQAAPILDSEGNLYGTTTYGGIAGKGRPTGWGVVYRLTPSGGTWQETTLYRFTGTPDGFGPLAGVTLDAAGNVYGVTSAGGTYDEGTIFELSPGASGWTETVLHSFTGNDGGNPEGTPVWDAAGNLLGTTWGGGTHNYGVVYKLSPRTGGWKLDVLYKFQGGTDGANPLAGVTLGPGGSLFGATQAGGALNGIAYELAPNGSGGWQETILHTFQGAATGDASLPNGLVYTHGKLFGSSGSGGTDNAGAIFEISPASGGAWEEKVLYNFTTGRDGATPSSSLITDGMGHLYGTTLWGGPAGTIDAGGVAFEFTP